MQISNYQLQDVFGQEEIFQSDSYNAQEWQDEIYCKVVV